MATASPDKPGRRRRRPFRRRLKFWRRHRPRQLRWLERLGPGLITGASDDDPSGIATYSQAGAGFGYGLLWTMLLTLPLMAAIQEISARIGRITGHGLAGNLRRHYPRALLYPVVFLLLLANTINIGADIGAMGAALNLLIGGPALLYAAAFAVGCLLLQIFSSYQRISRGLRVLTLALFSYIATVLLSHVHWSEALRGTVLPALHLSGNYWATFIALLGTTISPYLFFWQAAQETEEIRAKPEDEPLKKAPEQARDQFGRIRFDTYLGMGFSNLVAWCIMVSAAATLHVQGVTQIDTAAQAAEALRPLAGRFAFVLFALGIVGTGLLAVPVLAGSAAYAVGEALKLPTGMDRQPGQAKGFYAILTAATLLGLAINFPQVQKLTHLSPIQALYWAAVINGVVAVPIMVVMMLMSHRKAIMGPYSRISKPLKLMGWLATLLMAAATAGLFLTWGQ